LFGRIRHAQSITLLWLAYRIGVIEQCCQMVSYSKFVYKSGVILHACVHGRRKDLSRGHYWIFLKVFAGSGDFLKVFAGSGDSNGWPG